MPELICILGPTATGKTALGIALAQLLDGEVVSADSMQVYRHMDIGTAKPKPEEMMGVRHYMLDVCEPDEDYSVARYVEDADTCVADILRRGKTPIIVGGSGLYIDALISGRSFMERPDSGLREELTRKAEDEGIDAVREILRVNDPASYAALHPNDKKRIIRAAEVFLQTGSPISAHNEVTSALPPKYDALKIGLTFSDRETLYSRIDMRVDKMLEDGLIDEVKSLLPRFRKGTAMQAIGYKEPLMYLRGECGLNEAMELLKRESRRYAKRQLTWFRRDEDIHWIIRNDGSDFNDAVRKAFEIVDDGLK